MLRVITSATHARTHTHTKARGCGERLLLQWKEGQEGDDSQAKVTPVNPSARSRRVPQAGFTASQQQQQQQQQKQQQQ